MLASSFFDPVLGVDVHFEMVPTPAPVPTPIPNPFVGIVFDPMGLAAGIAMGAAIGAVVGAPFRGPVMYWTAFPATNTGTEAKHVPGHILIPPGVSWAPFPKTPKPVIHPGETPKPALPVKPEDDAVIVFGSKTVTVMGSNAVRLGDIALSCSEPLRLPSSVVLAVPKGAPILIGGPPSLDLMAAVMASLRTRFVSDSLHAMLSRLKPSRFRNFMHRAVCFFTGHPVDVASGKLVTEFIDANLPGPLPLRIERIYSSAFASRSGPLGHGWSCSLDQAVWRERGKVVQLREDGREIEFDTFDLPGHQIAAGQEVYNEIERATLRCEANGCWQITEHDGQVRTFEPVVGRRDQRAMIRQHVSRGGYHRVEYHYGASGWLESVVDSCGRVIYLRHDHHGRIVELVLPHPEAEGHYCHRRYGYDDFGDLTAVVDSLGQRWGFSYVGHLLTRERDRTAMSYYFGYDGHGEDAWCIRTWGDGGVHDHVITYDKVGRKTFVTNSLGRTTQYHMNLVGQVIKIVDPLGGEVSFEYDPKTLQRVAEIDENGVQTRWRHDDRGRMIAAEHGSGLSSMRYEYEGDFHLPISEQGNDGARWRWSYDRSGLVTNLLAPDGSENRWLVERGLCTRMLTPGGKPTSFAYDRHGNLEALTLASGLHLQILFDRLGRAQLWRANDGSGERIRWDTEGRPLTVVSATEQWQFTTDAEGRLVLAESGDRRVERRFGPGGALVAQTESGQTVAYEHDSELQLIAVTNEAGEVARFEWNEAGLLAAEVGFDGARTKFGRDPAGRLVTLEQPSGDTISYAHDALDRTVEVAASDGNKTTFSYDETGLLRGVSNSAGTVEFEYDVLGRIVRESFEGDHVETVRGPDGELLEQRSSLGGRIRAQHDTRGNLSAHELGFAGVEARIDLAHDQAGRERARRLPGYTTVQSQWTASGRPLISQISVLDGQRTGYEVVARRDYRWGPAIASSS